VELIMSENTQDKNGYPASEVPIETALEAASNDRQLDIRHATTDERLIDLWVHGRSRHTQRAYRADAGRFVSFTSKPLFVTRLDDLQSFSDALDAHRLAPATKHRVLSSVKSLFAFGHRLGYLPFDTAKPLKLPPLRDQLSERILEEADVQRMLALEPNPRNAAMLYLLYAAGLRVSELSLRWRDIQSRSDRMGQVTVFGKGGKTRTILIPASVKARLDGIRAEAADDSPVFVSRKRRAVSNSQVLRIVKAAAKRAGIGRNVVAHSLRHSHASHSMEHGAPIHLVQQTLGHADLSTTGRYLHARPNDSSARFLRL
jgi:integrase/recombinase XerD